MELVIAGAYYYNSDSDMILIPHYTGEFNVVDCDIFIRLGELKLKYDENYIKNVKHNPIIYDNKKYYNAEYSSMVINNWELLSDLSELSHLEENFDW